MIGVYEYFDLHSIPKTILSRIWSLSCSNFTGLVFLSMEVKSKRSDVPFAFSLLAYVFLMLVYRAFPNISQLTKASL